jgi:hypothetical protein
VGAVGVTSAAVSEGETPRPKKKRPIATEEASEADRPRPRRKRAAPPAEPSEAQPAAGEEPPAPPPGAKGKLGSWSYVVVAAAIAATIAFISYNSSKSKDDGREAEVSTQSASKNPLRDEDMPAFATAVGKAWAGEKVDVASLPARLGEKPQSVYVAFRAKGDRLGAQWVHPSKEQSLATMWDALALAIERGKADLGDRLARADRLEIDLTRNYRRLAYATDFKHIVDEYSEKTPRHRGLRGLSVKQGDKLAMWAPTLQLAENKSNRDRIEGLRVHWEMTEEQVGASEFATFEADQVLVRLDKSPVEAVSMFRGNRVVDIDEVRKPSTEKLATGMAQWIIHNVGPEGRLTYELRPSTGKEADGNNQIRQWMATNALILWAADRGDTAVFDLAEKNIDYNLGKFYSEDGELGRINEGQKVKLGAVALAAMALHTHPKRAKWAKQLGGLRRMVDHLWKEDGSFSSFYAGSTGEFWNFYPGEALLFWAALYETEKDPEILRKYKASFAFFKQWHLEPKNRNPAFVPWHIQANYKLWKALGDDEAELKKELVAFNLEIADWLVGVQQWDGETKPLYPDELGRFYKKGASFGPPHASSTGVYIEGLIDAWQLAKELGDAPRRETYRVSLVRGLRSMMQLQFVDDVDLYYVAEPEKVVGGIRTTEYDSDIRCDNVQHPLMGIIKILRLFGDGEYEKAR